MARLEVDVNLQNMYDVIIDNPTTIDAGVVTSGIWIKDALNNKTGSTRIQVSNTSLAGGTISLMKGQLVDLDISPYGGFATGVNTVQYTIPAGMTVTIIINQYEGYIKKLDGSIYVDFSVGFTGTINVDAEKLHIYESDTTPKAVFI
jgi:hypothetical protein